ncbi:MAG TPA: hypothetical protein VIM99_10325 [Blastocatellia bacterium]
MNFTRNRIVGVGGGFGGLFTALNLAGEGEVTLVSRSDHFLFTPLLYECLSGEAISLGLDRAAALAGGRVLDGPLARQARFALYSLRLPTWQRRLRVKASWFFEGASPRSLGLHQAIPCSERPLADRSIERIPPGVSDAWHPGVESWRKFFAAARTP